MDKDFQVKEFKIHYEDTQDEAVEIFEDDHRLEQVELLDIWEV